ncbi:ATP synthase subunit I [Pseudocolwellia sp. HL-MZ7]|uniref:N-ATPase subunit AtpR n=1 Tax=Pseudocolwellia sp. HL-MZ7 TaxID=3400627 RepID=UPI003CF09D54
MSDLLGLILIFLLGLWFGSFFFIGLWWTVQKSVQSTHPASWIVISFVVRMSVTVSGFYLVVIYQTVDPAWLRLMVCFSGFIIARFIISRVISSAVSNLKSIENISEEHPPEDLNTSQGSHHAP